MSGLIEQRKLDMHEYLANERIEELQAESNLLRNALAERNAKYWELYEAVSRLYKTIEGEKRSKWNLKTEPVFSEQREEGR